MKAVSNFTRLSLAVSFTVLLCAVTGASLPVNAQTTRARAAARPPVPPTDVKVTPLPATAVVDKLAPAGWTRYEIGRPARFSLILPAAPQTDAARMEAAPGLKVTAHTYVRGTDAGFYGATYIDDLPASVGTWTAANKKIFFDSFIKGFAEGFQAGLKGTTPEQLEMQEQRAATANGLAGYEQDFTFGPLSGRVRVVFDGRRAYAMMAFINAVTSAAERQTFFDSFRLGGKR